MQICDLIKLGLIALVVWLYSRTKWRPNKPDVIGQWQTMLNKGELTQDTYRKLVDVYKKNSK